MTDHLTKPPINHATFPAVIRFTDNDERKVVLSAADIPLMREFVVVRTARSLVN